MRFDENLGQFVYEYEGIIFAGDEEPGEDFPDTVKKLAANYYESRCYAAFVRSKSGCSYRGKP